MTHVRHALALAMVTLAASNAQAADVTPEARRLLDDVARAYKAVPSYADKGEVTLTYATKPGTPPVKQVSPARIALARPNKVAIDAGIVRINSDGKTLRTTVPPFKTFRDVPATARLSLGDFADGPLGAFEGGSPQGRPLDLILAFLLAEDPVKALVDDARSIKATIGGKYEGQSRDQLVYEPQVGPTLTLWVDPATRLIDRIEVNLSAKDASAGLVPNSPIALDSLSWSAGKIATKDLPDDTFTLIRPDKYTEIAQLAKDTAKKKAENELLDKQSPDFTLNILDGPGKTRRVKKADLAGKVVLIDFWATWCGPCLRELPDIQKLIADYAKAGKSVAVVALSIDEAEDGDVDEVRAKVEKTLKAAVIDLEVKPVGLIALDPSAIIARAFGVNAIPHLVVIDAQGIVRHVHIGVTERDVLVEEIDALLGQIKKPG
jgi:thiol-disulfide isomerase/thioredoxin